MSVGADPSMEQALRRATALVGSVLPAPDATGPPPSGLRDRLVEAGRDLVLGAVETAVQEQLELQRWISAAVRRPQHRPRVVGIVAGKGGVGATTTALAVASTLSALREDTTALVRIQPDPLPRPRTDIAAVELAPGTSANDVLDQIDALSNQHGFTVLDVGNDASAAGQAALLSADQVVVVSGTGPESIEHARLALRRVQAGRAGLDDAVAVTVQLVRRGGSGMVRQLPRELGLVADRWVAIGYDRRLARTGWSDPDSATRATLAAYLTVTALITTTLSTPTGQPSR